MPLISISVPVYNVDKYLHQCLDSLLNQTLTDIEIIIVDDGSTDGSSQICDEYANNDRRIKVIHKENGGLALARQAALEVATGKYFCACDADDWVELNMYEQLYNKAEETSADIVMCGYWAEYSNGKQITHHCHVDLENHTDLFGNAMNGILPCQVWNKLFRRDLFTHHHINWEQGINLGEDFFIMLKILQYPIKMVNLNMPLYHYRRIINSTSYTNNITLDSFKQNLSIRYWIQEHIDTQKYANGVFRLWINSAFTGLRVRDGITKKFYKNEVLCYIPFSGFIKYSYPRLKGILIFLTKLFGYDFGKWLFKLCYQRVYK